MDRIETLLRAMTLEEKCSIVAGKNMWETLDIPRLGIRSLKTTDGPAGVRGATWIDGTHTTFIPCGIALGATFDAALVERVGQILGAETRSKRSHVLLAPTMNISRSPLAGRNFENFGEDPRLTGVLAAAYIRGVQAEAGVGACMKHYVANDMETRRFNMDEQVDARALREIYLKPFEIAREADPWTAMAAYPKINGVHADCSVPLLKDILRGEWRFEGPVMSDWGGLNDTVQSIVAGTDLEMPGPPIRYGAALQAAVQDGRVSETEHLDVSARRLLKLLDRAGLLDPEAAVAPGDEQDSDRPEFRQTAREAAAGGIVLLKNGVRKDGTPMLPLDAKAMKRLVVVGPNAAKPTTGGTGSAAVNPYYITTPLGSLTEAAKAANAGIEVVHERGIRTNLQPGLPPASTLKTPDGSQAGLKLDFYAGTEFQGPVVGSSVWQSSVIFMMSDGDTPEELRGTAHSYRARGVLTPAASGTYDVSLSSTGKARLYVDDVLVLDNTEWTQAGGTFMNCGSVNITATLDLIVGQAYSIRIDNIVVPPPLPPHDNTLFHTLSGVRVGIQIQEDEDALFAAAVAAARDPAADAVVVVVGHNNDTEKEGIDRTSLQLPRRTDEFVSAMCAAAAENHRPLVVVTQSACAIAMPWASEAPALVHAWYQGQENGNALADVLLGAVTPSGKLPLTFPHRLEDHGSHKWFPGDVANDRAVYGEGVLVGYRFFDAQGTAPLWPFGFGLSYTTFAVSDVHATGSLGKSTTIVATVTNTGTRDGAEVVQVYAGPSPVLKQRGLDAAPRSLVGFAKVDVAAGASQTVTIALDRNVVSWFDVSHGPNGNGGWRVDPGTYAFSVGTSSREIVATVDVEVTD